MKHDFIESLERNGKLCARCGKFASFVEIASASKAQMAVLLGGERPGAQAPEPPQEVPAVTPAQPEERCMNCRFSHRVDVGIREWLVCRRYPPRGGGSESVSSDWWCGEWQRVPPKPDEPPKPNTTETVHYRSKDGRNGCEESGKDRETSSLILDVTCPVCLATINKILDGAP